MIYAELFKGNFFLDETIFLVYDHLVVWHVALWSFYI